MPPFIAICTRPSPSIPASSERRNPGFAVPILPVHRNALFLRIHPIALQGQRRSVRVQAALATAARQQRQREQAT